MRACLTAIVACTAIAVPAKSEITALRNAAIVSTADGRVRTRQTIIVEDGRIISVQAASRPVPRGSRTIDLKGRYVIPGLIDSHVHLPMKSLGILLGEAEPQTLADQQDSLAPYLAAGVTSVAVLSGGPDLLELKQAIAARRITGPALIVASPMIAGAEPIIPPPVSYPIDGPADAAPTIRKFRAVGYDLVKLREDLTTESAGALITEGNRAGLPVVGHIPRTLGDFDDLLVGRFGFAHLYELLNAKPYEEQQPIALARLLQRRGSWVVTTLGVHYNNIAKNGDYPATLVADGAAYVHPQLFKMWQGNSFEPNSQNAILQRQIGQQNALLRSLVRTGVPVVAGSDAGNPTISPGQGFHNELSYLSAAGLSPLQVLQSATRTPARIWNIPAGSVEPGNRADLVVLDRNPLKDLSVLRRPVAVMIAGQWLDRAELERMLSRAATLRRKVN